MRGAARTLGLPPVGAPLIVGPGARRVPFALCAEVLNAIMQYKDTIGNSMARVLCTARDPSSYSDQTFFFRRER